MVSTALRHAVYDMAIRNVLDGLIDTFGGSDDSETIPDIGAFFSKVMHIDGTEVFRNCIIRAIEHPHPGTTYVRLMFEYMDDMVDGDTMTIDEFTDIYGDDYEGDDSAAEDDDEDIPDDDTIDLIVNNDDRTVSMNMMYYVFIP